MADITYTKLSSAQIQETRNLVISECSRGGYTLAQQVTIEEGGKKTNVFLKNAIHIGDVSGLINLRDALNVAIDKVPK
jgi:hypothetical protein